MAIDSNLCRASPSSLPALDGLQSTRSKKRIDQIDRIRSYGIGDIVSLPQIIVCGDQSAGKSSVLEGITGMPFPRKDGICTRFPTEIILRRSLEEKSIAASVQPHPSRPAATRGLLSGYRRSMANMSELPEVTYEVSACMGVRGHPEVTDGSAFALDVLRIEIKGYTDFNLTVVDLPGLISVSNEEQTDADVELIRTMVEDYVSSSRAIILAVVQAGNDIANQSIVELARKHDLQGQRTVGIITKADLINKGTEGRLNPTPAELEAGVTAQQRLVAEMDFFSSHIWQSQGLDMSRVGVVNLRIFLQDLLDSHIEKELPNVIEEVKHQLRNAEASLCLMGPERSSVGDIRFFMTNISMDIYQFVQNSLNGDYYGTQRDYFQADSKSKLRAVIHRLNTNFAARMRDSGQKRQISSAAACDSKDVTVCDLENIAPTVQRLLVSEQSMDSWAKSVYADTRGRELPGNHNYVLVAELFREQSTLWGPIAKAHVRDVFTALAQWIKTSVVGIIQEPKVKTQIVSICLRWLDDAELRADKELEKLLTDEKQHPITYNHYYTDNIQTARHNALFKPIQSVLKDTFKVDPKDKEATTTVDLSLSLGAIRGKIIVNMDQQACSDALICLNAYYKVALKTFVDNVCRQVIERHILVRLPEIFSPSMIAQLPDEEILHLGSESKSHKRKREGLLEKQRMLKTSLEDLQQS
ncbi:dynamin GTPase [Apiospora kogelbergensis]|uniref:dynamin GTPase n=1 Tax=Apiospora kogelbergensis TaxID=1337665 RepID=UPI0031319C9D